MGDDFTAETDRMRGDDTDIHDIAEGLRWNFGMDRLHIGAAADQLTGKFSLPIE